MKASWKSLEKCSPGKKTDIFENCGWSLFATGLFVLKKHYIYNDIGNDVGNVYKKQVIIHSFIVTVSWPIFQFN